MEAASGRRREGRADRAAPRLAALGLALWLGLGGALAHAEEDPEDGQTATLQSLPAGNRLPTSEQRSALAQEIEALRASGDDTAREVDALERLDQAWVQIEAAQLQRSEREAELERLKSRAGEAPGEALGGPPPYPLPVFDRTADALDAATRTLAELEAARKSAQAELEAAEQAADASERELRKVREAAGQAGADEATRRDLRVAEIEQRIADAIRALRREESTGLRAEVQVAEIGLERARALHEYAAAHLALRAEDRSAALDELEARRLKLDRSLERSRLELDAETARWKAAQARLANNPDPGPVERAQQSAARARFTARQREVAVLADAVARVDAAREGIQRRFAALSGEASRAALLDWVDESRSRLEEIDRRSHLEQAQIAALKEEIAGLGLAPPGAERALALRREALASTIAIHERDLQRLRHERRREQRVLDALETRSATRTLRDWLDAVVGAVDATWNYEITDSEDRPITVGKVTTALLIVALGMGLARRATEVMGRRVFLRLGLEPGAAAAFESLAFYAMLVAIFVLALRTVDIPLTAFAVVGGALAIGVGFGSQNIVNNFISGVILLLERPLKAGDLVELDDTYGNIERIGLRSTRIRTGQNIHVIVPNASLLENKVVNWTHTDERVRLRVDVGVAYGSPTRTVEELLFKAVLEHPRVLKDFDPIVLFSDFGNDALLFQVHFWTHMRLLMDRLSLESELRFRIDELFREAGITIAFPQRDVHLDARSPIPVHVVREPGERGDG